MSLKTFTFVSSIARALNAAHIPCVLWGHLLLNVHGVPSIIESVDYIVRDADLRAAARALARLEALTPCLHGETCSSGPGERYTPPPAHHMHIKDTDISVGLYLQSETLWFLPTLDHTLVSPHELALRPHFILASDRSILPPYRPGWGLGAFLPDLPPVVVPNAVVLLEAYMRLYVRDSKLQIGSVSMAMITYIEEYVDDDGHLDATQLPEPFKTFYSRLRQGDQSVRFWRKELITAVTGIEERDSGDDDIYSTIAECQQERCNHKNPGASQRPEEESDSSKSFEDPGAAEKPLTTTESFAGDTIQDFDLPAASETLEETTNKNDARESTPTTQEVGNEHETHKAIDVPYEEHNNHNQHNVTKSSQAKRIDSGTHEPPIAADEADVESN